jgi:type II secretory pathway pseudopilin PulG
LNKWLIRIIAILMAMLMPAIKKARQQALVTQCASNLRQISIALQSYLNDNQMMTFWRADDINLDGMDWYGYGGRETGNANLDQANYFNRLVPRPLNKYLSNKLEIFRCPCDDAAPWTSDLSFTIYFAPSQFEWVGNSYQFNANGYPLRPLPRHDPVDRALDGARAARGDAEVEVREVGDADTVELGREPGHVQVELPQPHPARFEPSVPGDRGGEACGTGCQRSERSQIWSFSITGLTDTTCRLNFSSDSSSPAATPTSCERCRIGMP